MDIDLDWLPDKGEDLFFWEVVQVGKFDQNIGRSEICFLSA